MTWSVQLTSPDGERIDAATPERRTDDLPVETWTEDGEHDTEVAVALKAAALLYPDSKHGAQAVTLSGSRSTEPHEVHSLAVAVRPIDPDRTHDADE